MKCVMFAHSPSESFSFSLSHTCSMLAIPALDGLKMCFTFLRSFTEMVPVLPSADHLWLVGSENVKK